MTEKPLKFRPPYALNLAEARAFGRICRDLQQRLGEVPAGLIDIAADYVKAGSRLNQLHMVLDGVVRSAGPSRQSTRLEGLNRQIDATTALSLRLGDRLGVTR